MNRSTMIILSLTVALTSIAFAKPDRSKLPEPAGATSWNPPAVDTWTLKNGMNVWFVQQKQAPLISLKLVLPMGSATDPKTKAGTTSLMADMLDEGAGDMDALQLSDAFAQLATDYSASASTDSMHFSLSMLADQLDASLALFATVLRTPTFPAKDFERVKSQRGAGALHQESDPSSVGFVVARRVMNGEGYGAFPSRGTRSTLERITLDDVKAQYGKLVQPAGSTIVVVGSVDKAALTTALEAHFGDWTGSQTGVPAEVATQTAPRGIHLVDFPGSSQSMVIVSRRVEGTKAKDYFPAQVFNRGFAGAFTARINMNLREDKGYTYGARGGFMRSRKTGTYTIYSKVKGETTRASLDEIIKELAWVRGEKPLTAEELSESKGGMVKSFPGRFERMGGVAGQLTTLVADGHSSTWLADWTKNISAIDLAAAHAMAQKYTNLDDFQIIVAGDRAKIEESLKGLKMPIYMYDTQGNALSESK